MVTQAKKIKTKKGDWMMFATLYDLETSVEIIVFGSVLESAEQALAVDTIVLVRGKVDHKDANKSVVLAQQVERFEPRPEEIAKAREEAAKPPPLPAPPPAASCLGDRASMPPRCPRRSWASSRSCCRASRASRTWSSI